MRPLLLLLALSSGATFAAQNTAQSTVQSTVQGTACTNLANPANPASPATIASGKTAANIVELFTSEGCDSCPPADKLFSTLRGSDASVIPLAFHVDYWDYIGWKDRFAKPGYAQRQRDEVARQGSRTVYTPQFLLNGKDWRSPGLQTSPGGIFSASLSPRPPKASLVLAFSSDAVSQAPPNTSENNNQIQVKLQVSIPDAVARKESAVFIAITENNLLSRVTAGENRGATLRHDHVVRELVGPIPVRLDGSLDITRNISLARDWKQADISIVAFVQSSRDGEILQAITSPLCR